MNNTQLKQRTKELKNLSEKSMVKNKRKKYKKEYDKEYYLKNKDKKKEYYKEYYSKNKDKENERIKEYRIKNKDKLKEYRKEYYKKPKISKPINVRETIQKLGIKKTSELTGYSEQMITSWLHNVYKPSEKQMEDLKKCLF